MPHRTPAAPRRRAHIPTTPSASHHPSGRLNILANVMRKPMEQVGCPMAVGGRGARCGWGWRLKAWRSPSLPPPRLTPRLQTLHPNPSCAAPYTALCLPAGVLRVCRAQACQGGGAGGPRHLHGVWRRQVPPGHLVRPPHHFGCALARMMGRGRRAWCGVGEKSVRRPGQLVCENRGRLGAWARRRGV